MTKKYIKLSFGLIILFIIISPFSFLNENYKMTVSSKFKTYFMFGEKNKGFGIKENRVVATTTMDPKVCTSSWSSDYDGSYIPEENCEQNWTTPSPAIAGDDKKDPYTGLTWSLPLINNNGVAEFSSSTDINDWTWNSRSHWSADGECNYRAGDKPAANEYNCPNANWLEHVSYNNWAVGHTSSVGWNGGTKEVGKTVNELCSERGNGWRLPTQEEAMKAYKDGSFFNLIQPYHAYWSSTGYGVPSIDGQTGGGDYNAYLNVGFVYYNQKLTVPGQPNPYYIIPDTRVRCVR